MSSSLAARIGTEEQVPGSMNITTNSAIPDINNLLVAKMLSDIAKPTAAEDRDNPFKSLGYEETKYLRAARKLLKTNAVLALRLGGHGLEQSIRLAALLKQRAEAQFMARLLDGTANELVIESMYENKDLSQLARPVYARSMLANYVVNETAGKATNEAWEIGTYKKDNAEYLYNRSSEFMEEIRKDG